MPPHVTRDLSDRPQPASGFLSAEGSGPVRVGRVSVDRIAPGPTPLEPAARPMDRSTPGERSLHEILDRLQLLDRLFAELVENHPLVQSDTDLMAAAEEVTSAVAEFYQSVESRLDLGQA